MLSLDKSFGKSFTVSKFAVRVLPTIIEYKEKTGEYPKCLSMALANLIYFYKNDTPEDNPVVIEIMKKSEFSDILKNEALWNKDISEMTLMVTDYYNKIKTLGAKESMKWILSE